MYRVNFYKGAAGNEPVREYLESLVAKEDKESKHKKLRRMKLKMQKEIRRTSLKGVKKMSKKKVSPIGLSWEEFEKKNFTPEEIAASNLRVALVGEIINSRQTKGLSQKQLEAISGVKQPIIARMERGTTDPQLSTLLKVLAPLGKTLAVVPLE